jgi:hypothetical protein
LAFRLTDRFAVVHAASPVAALDFDEGAFAGDPPGLAVLTVTLGLWLLAGADGGADDADCPFPDDPQPAASAAAATSDDTATPRRAATAPRRAWPELVIIPIPLVVARNAPRTRDRSSQLLNVAPRPVFLY